MQKLRVRFPLLAVETLWKTGSKNRKPQIQNGYYNYSGRSRRWHRIVDVGFDREVHRPSWEAEGNRLSILPTVLDGALYPLFGQEKGQALRECVSRSQGARSCASAVACSAQRIDLMPGARCPYAWLLLSTKVADVPFAHSLAAFVIVVCSACNSLCLCNDKTNWAYLKQFVSDGYRRRHREYKMSVTKLKRYALMFALFVVFFIAKFLAQYSGLFFGSSLYEAKR